MIETVELKPLTPETFGAFFALIAALADFEKLPPPDDEAAARLKDHAFAERPKFEALLAFAGSEPVGYAIFFETYSSFLAKPTLYLEDVFVIEPFRGRKVASQIFRHLTALAAERQCGRMEWQVLEWNTPAIKFYQKLGAVHQAAW
ncbi:MAG: GNAT family N-acetyltransferase, partial [Rhizobacter sp.]|nr:GNAT family N-acetyltransferase [Chlorobiales bacterium]